MSGDDWDGASSQPRGGPFAAKLLWKLCSNALSTESTEKKMGGDCLFSPSVVELLAA